MYKSGSNERRKGVNRKSKKLKNPIFTTVRIRVNLKFNGLAFLKLSGVANYGSTYSSNGRDNLNHLPGRCP